MRTSRTRQTIALTPRDAIVPAGWSTSVAGGTSTAAASATGVVTLTGDGTNAARADQAINTIKGRRYRLTVAASAAVSVSVGTGVGDASLASQTVTGSGDVFFTASGAVTYIRLLRTAVGATVVTNLTSRVT